MRVCPQGVYPVYVNPLKQSETNSSLFVLRSSLNKGVYQGLCLSYHASYTPPTVVSVVHVVFVVLKTSSSKAHRAIRAIRFICVL